jgi:RNAse (barnase) inhibitor barstar
MSVETIRWGLRYKQRSGVYGLRPEIDAESVKQLAEEFDYNFLYIDGTQIQNEKDFFAVSSVALMFPDYCAHDWDGFFDCLKDLSSVPDKEADIIFFDHFDQFARIAPLTFRHAFWVFDAAAYQRCISGSPFRLFVMLRGEEQYIPRISYFDEGLTL